MRTPPLLADFSHARACKPFCENSLTLPIDLALTGANIMKLRKAAGLSVHDLQSSFGFNSPQAIYKWQNGTALPTVDNLVVLASLLGVRIDDILVIAKHAVA